ncbi:isoprenoid synthase domain-containing protein [Tricharina praecox]|uniref:isoprenoid synthase domain-containing protein n=1 Tax=Tricharina praecox TaxID=43433 RepID=UPI002221204E|nr:isoprenoid synthase domain-containing protein [Tricharina praecox]KAI5851896.1 isoprenoid synthase domain-containing protein [Tricharina praecox]
MPPIAITAANQPTPERPLGLNLDGTVLKTFLNSLNFDIEKEAIPRNLELEAAMQRVFEAENLPPKSLAQVLQMLPFTCAASEMSYYTHPFAIKVFIATYITLLLYLDDLCEKDPAAMVPELTRVVATVGSGGGEEHQYHPSIRHFLRLVREDAPKHYGPLSTGVIVKSTIDYFVGCLIESQYPKGVKCPASAGRFPRYLRLKSGNSEAFAHMIFPEERFPERKFLETYLPTIPDIVELTYMINDCLSMYKESIVGTEENTYFMSMGKVHRCDPVDVLVRTGVDQAGLARDVSATLDGKEELKEAFETYLSGYIMYHCTQKRYRLAELGISMEPSRSPQA